MRIQLFSGIIPSGKLAGGNLAGRVYTTITFVLTIKMQGCRKQIAAKDIARLTGGSQVLLLNLVNSKYHHIEFAPKFRRQNIYDA